MARMPRPSQSRPSTSPGERRKSELCHTTTSLGSWPPPHDRRSVMTHGTTRPQSLPAEARPPQVGVVPIGRGEQARPWGGLPGGRPGNWQPGCTAWPHPRAYVTTGRPLIPHRASIPPVEICALPIRPWTWPALTCAAQPLMPSGSAPQRLRLAGLRPARLSSELTAFHDLAAEDARTEFRDELTVHVDHGGVSGRRVATAGPGHSLASSHV